MIFDALNESHSNEQALVAVNRRARLPDAIIAPLLDLLCTDDGFRARFEREPRAALRELGYETPTADMGVLGADPVMNLSYFNGGLASKEKFAAFRERWLAHEEASGLPFGPFMGCAR